MGSTFFFASHAAWESQFAISDTPLQRFCRKKKWSFHCRGVTGIDFVLPMLRMKHIFLCCPCSVRSLFLKSISPLVYKWHFFEGGEFVCSCGAVHGFVARCYFSNYIENFPSELQVVQHRGCIFVCRHFHGQTCPCKDAHTHRERKKKVYTNIYIYIYVYAT